MIELDQMLGKTVSKVTRYGDGYLEIEFTDDNFFKRWDWILNEMIWAFEQSTTEWEHQYYSGECDIQFKELENGLSTIVNGPNDTFKVDRDGVENHRKRMERGRMLFAKYYESLWS